MSETLRPTKISNFFLSNAFPDCINSFHSEYALINGQKLLFRFDADVWGAVTEISAREQRTFQEICEAVHFTKAPDASIENAFAYFVYDYFRCLSFDDESKFYGRNIEITFDASTIH